jgi:hypothetical protein
MFSRPEIIRWNGTYTNPEVAPSPIVIKQTRETPLVNNPKEYQVAVETFNIDTTESPIFTCTARQQGATSINDLDYYVQFVWSGNVYTQYLQMDSSFPQYAPPSVSPDNSVTYPPYYWINSYAQFIGMINVALKACMVLLKAGAYPTPDNVWPYIQMDVRSGTIGFVVPTTMVANAVNFIFENQLMDKLNLPFSTIINNNVGYPTPNIAHQIASTAFDKFKDATTNFLSTTISNTMSGTPYWTGTAVTLVNDHDYRASWFDIYKILIVSNMAAPEGTSLASGTSSTQGGSQNLLASYTLDLNGSDHVNGQLLFTPFFNKWCSLVPSEAIQMINIEFLYQTKTGAQYPILQTFGRTADIKLIFKRNNAPTSELGLPNGGKILRKRKLGE